MRKTGRHRVLTVGEQQYFWRTAHRHVPGCEEVLRLRRRGSVAGLTLVFRPGGERHIPDGGVSAAGVIWIGDRLLNLNTPRVVRAFVDGAVRRGWMTEAATVGHRDGWALFDEAYARIADNSTMS
ncbi:hypothetical protein [Nocardia rhamnosiphila]